MYTSQAQVRAAFWEANPDVARNPCRQNNQPTDTRCAFVDFVDSLARNGDISESLADRVTL